MRWLDGVVLAQFYPEELVGQYAIAYRVALLGSFALLSINSALGPRITAFDSSGEQDKIISETRKSTKLGFWITAPIILITLLFPKMILGIFGEDFVSAYPAMLILLIGQFVNTIIGPNGIVLQLTGHQRIFKNIVLFTVAFNILANYLLIPVYGIIGAAIVNSVSILYLENLVHDNCEKSLWSDILLFTLAQKMKLDQPKFLIIGAAKCGTTSLFDQLCEHPEVFTPTVKEPGFLIERKDLSSIRSEQEYKNLFKEQMHLKQLVKLRYLIWPTLSPLD